MELPLLYLINISLAEKLTNELHRILSVTPPSGVVVSTAKHEAMTLAGRLVAGDRIRLDFDAKDLQTKYLPIAEAINDSIVVISEEGSLLKAVYRDGTEEGIHVC